MSTPDPARRVAELRSRIEDANQRYHQHDAPDITDAQYDALVRELEALEAQHPELAASDSPTRRVGAAPAGRFPPVVHAVPMLSLGNAFEDGEVLADLTVPGTRFIAAEGGYGGILGVGQGSSRPPRLVVVRYAPEGATKHLSLVGKGITFDSGGLSLKPPAGMVGMKYDMTGAATVLAVVLAVARLGLPLTVTARLCIAENMPSGTATRPNDVLTMRGGTTVEVLNTDAEGRLVLADGLVAASRTQPDVIIDVAAAIVDLVVVVVIFGLIVIAIIFVDTVRISFGWQGVCARWQCIALLLALFSTCTAGVCMCYHDALNEYIYVTFRGSGTPSVGI